MQKLKDIFEKITKNKVQRESELEEVAEKSADSNVWKGIFNQVMQIARIVAMLFTAFQLYTAITVPLPAMVQRSIHFGFASFLVFILFPLKTKNGKHLVLVDIFLAVASLITSSYIAINYYSIASRVGTYSNLDITLGIFMLVVVLEGTRRVMGLPMPIIAVVFLLYARFGNLLPGLIAHRGYGLGRIASTMYLTTEGIFGTPLGVSATFVAIFVTFGVMLQKTGGGEFIMKFASACVGHVRGGPAKIATVSSCLFGTISGSVVANVVTDGIFTIPMMNKAGYDLETSAAIEATASTGGMIMPPVMGAGAFIMAEILGRPYWDIVIAAALPGILYYVSLWSAVDLKAASKGIRGVPRKELESPWSVLKDGWSFIIPIGVLFYLLSSAGFTAIKAGLWAVIVCYIVAQLKPSTRLNLKQLLEVLESSGKGLLEVAMVCACAGIIIGVFSLTGLGLKLSSILIQLSGGRMLLLLLLTMVCCLILGMGVTTTAAYIVLAVLVAPALVQMGVLPIAAHLFIFHIAALANVTPPVALGAYAAAAVGKCDPIKTGLIAFKLAMPAILVPFFFVYNPVLLLQDFNWNIVVILATTIIGIVTMVASLEGYLLRKMHRVERILLFIGAILMIDPGWVTDIIGICILLASVVYQKISLRGISDTIEGGVKNDI